MTSGESRISPVQILVHLLLAGIGCLPVSFLMLQASSVAGQWIGGPSWLGAAVSAYVYSALISWPIVTAATVALFRWVGTRESKRAAPPTTSYGFYFLIFAAVTWLALLPAAWSVVLLDDALDYIPEPNNPIALQAYQAEYYRNSLLATAVWLFVAAVAILPALSLIAFNRNTTTGE